jgi:hypothetical protein
MKQTSKDGRKERVSKGLKKEAWNGEKKQR